MPNGERPGNFVVGFRDYKIKIKNEVIMKQFLLISFFCAATSAVVAQTVLDLPVPSQKATVAQRVGLTDVTVEYFRPAVNGRKIWGGLVPYGFQSPGINGAPWRTGANTNTTFSVTDDIKVEGKELKAGTYGFFVAVNENNTATIVFSRESKAWGSFFYNPEEDVLRVNVNTKTINMTELLTFSFDEVLPKSTVLSVKWADKEIPVRIDVDVDKIVITSIREQFKNPVTFSWHSRSQAAAYLAAVNSHLDLALQWANESIDGAQGIIGFPGEKNFITLTTKSDILAALDSVPQSRQVLAEALKNAGNTSIGIVNFYARSLITAKRKEDALTVFGWMQKQWPDNWLAKHGMARGLSANGRYKEALKFEMDAYAAAPEPTKKSLEGLIELLKQGKDIN